MSGVRYCIPELVILDRAAARDARREVKRVDCCLRCRTAIATIPVMEIG
jgi:hypothetical protein